MKPAYDVFAEVIGRDEDNDMCTDALWGMSYLVQSDDQDPAKEDLDENDPEHPSQQ